MITAWLGAAAIGLTLGLLGSGGSILTVPVLVYLVGESNKVAITESLAIVGTIALVGVLPYVRKGLIDGRIVALFGGPGLVGAYAGAALARFVPGGVQLVLFATVMLAAAWTMYRGRKGGEEGGSGQAAWKTALEGLAVGTLTGFVGVGGGFLVVPALVLLVGLPMRRAVGTSLLIVALNSFAGFAKHASTMGATGEQIDWALVGLFAAIGVAGALVGTRLGQHVPQAALRRGFSFFLVAMGVFILWQELPGVLGS